MTHEPAKEKLPAVTMMKMPHGGYVVIRGRCRGEEGHYAPDLAAFSTLPEAIAWIAQNMEVVP